MWGGLKACARGSREISQPELFPACVLCLLTPSSIFSVTAAGRVLLTFLWTRWDPRTAVGPPLVQISPFGWWIGPFVPFGRFRRRLWTSLGLSLSCLCVPAWRPVPSEPSSPSEGDGRLAEAPPSFPGPSGNSGPPAPLLPGFLDTSEQT